ncbi:MAG: hypothetical protein WC840_03445 [Candidatus Peribacteraceae bacterium]
MGISPDFSTAGFTGIEQSAADSEVAAEPCSAASSYCDALPHDQGATTCAAPLTLFGVGTSATSSAPMDEKLAVLLVQAFANPICRREQAKIIVWYVDKRCAAGDRELAALPPDKQAQKALRGIEDMRAQLGMTWRKGFVTSTDALTLRGRKTLVENWELITERLGKLDAVELTLIQPYSRPTLLAPLRAAIGDAMAADPEIDMSGLRTRSRELILNKVTIDFHQETRQSHDIGDYYSEGLLTPRALTLIRELAFRRRPGLDANPAKRRAEAEMNTFTARPSEDPLDLLGRGTETPTEERTGSLLSAHQEAAYNPEDTSERAGATATAEERKARSAFEGSKRRRVMIREVAKLIRESGPADAQAQDLETRANAIARWMVAQGILEDCVQSDGKITDMGKRAVARIQLHPELLARVPSTMRAAHAAKRAEVALPFTDEQLFDAVLDSLHAFEDYGFSRFERDQLRRLAADIAHMIKIKIETEYRVAGDVSRYYESESGTFTKRVSNLARIDIKNRAAAGANILASVTGKIVLD